MRNLGPGRANNIIGRKFLNQSVVNKTETSGRESQYFNITHHALNGVNEELENEFKKQTKLESHVTLLTIKRTLT